MHNVPLQVADAIFNWSNVILVVGAVLAFLGTVGVFWSTGIRERYADQRIAANEAETAKAKAEVAKANLEQEKLKAQMAWRRISSEQAKHIITNLKGFNLELWLSFVGNDPESTIFREDLNRALTAAGVKTEFYSGYARAIGLGVRGGQPGQREIILKAFRAAGVPAIETHEKSIFGDKLEILVGTKPPSDFYE